MRFLADESCDFTAVRVLRQAGHEVLTVRDSAPGAEDEEVLALAFRENVILLTEDRHSAGRYTPTGKPPAA